MSNFNTYGNNVHTIMGKDMHKNHHINNKEENDCVKVYINKLKEKKNEIERLKQQLLQEEKTLQPMFVTPVKYRNSLKEVIASL